MAQPVVSAVPLVQTWSELSRSNAYPRRLFATGQTAWALPRLPPASVEQQRALRDMYMQRHIDEPPAEATRWRCEKPAHVRESIGETLCIIFKQHMAWLSNLIRCNYKAIEVRSGHLLGCLQMELRLHPISEPMRMRSFSQPPPIETWVSHWEYKFEALLAASEVCVICFEPLFLARRATPCKTCRQDVIHRACRIRCVSCPLCRS